MSAVAPELSVLVSSGLGGGFEVTCGDDDVTWLAEAADVVEGKELVEDVLEAKGGLTRTPRPETPQLSLVSVAMCTRQKTNPDSVAMRVSFRISLMIQEYFPE